MSIQSAITKLFVSGMLLSLPSFLNTAKEAVFSGESANTMAKISSPEKAQTMGDLAVTMQSSMQSMTDMMSILAYIMGVAFAFMAALEFKAYNESFNNEDEEEEPSNKVNLEKSVSLIKKDETVKVAIKKIEEVKDAVFKKEKLYDYDFEDKDLSELGVQIQNKVKYLKNHSFLQKDMESLLMVENTDKEYLRVIHEKYVEIPFSKRGNKKMENSPYSLTASQLELLLKGLDEIENKIVKNNIMDQKANEIFLKQKVANM